MLNVTTTFLDIGRMYDMNYIHACMEEYSVYINVTPPLHIIL